MYKSYMHSRFTLVSTIVVFVCIGLFPAYKVLRFRINYQTEIGKCPSLGSNMCNCFTDNKFRLNWDNFWTNSLNIFLEKNIIFGNCEGKNVVLKWAGSEHNLEAIKPVPYIEENPNLKTVLEALQSLSKSKNVYNLGEDFVLCPSSEKLGILLKPITDGKRFIPRSELCTNLFYTMQANMEAVIQQITDQWAVARYLGACGDISVSEYCGYTLTNVFPELTWEKRSSIARQLLHFAFNATFDNPAFAFYFTDLSPDNFAVSLENEIRLVDLDNVIVVDKNPSDMPSDWNTVHISSHDENIRGFAFSTEEICSHRISDMNFYSICQGILSMNSDLLPGGLLHSAPRGSSTLNKLVDDCRSPPDGQSRIGLAQSILQVLNDKLDH